LSRLHSRSRHGLGLTALVCADTRESRGHRSATAEPAHGRRAVFRDAAHEVAELRAVGIREPLEKAGEKVAGRSVACVDGELAARVLTDERGALGADDLGPHVIRVL